MYIDPSDSNEDRGESELSFFKRYGVYLLLYGLLYFYCILKFFIDSSLI